MPPLRRVLVTGGTGFIGKVLVRSLRAVRDIDEVVLLTRDRAKSTGEVPEMDRLRFLVRDLVAPDLSDCFATPVEVVFHLAGLKLDPARPRPDSVYEQLNITASLALAAAAARAGVRHFVFFSSTGVHGETENGAQNESSPCRPANIYERTKLEAELSLERFAPSTPMAVTVLRPSNVFGPAHPSRHLLTLLRTIQRGQLVLPRRDGWTNFVGVEDVADAAVRIGLATPPSASRFRRFIVNCPLRAGDFAHAAAMALEVPPRFRRVPNPLLNAAATVADVVSWAMRRQLPVTRRKIQELTRDSFYSSQRLQAELAGWPARGLLAELQATVNSYRLDRLL